MKPIIKSKNINFNNKTMFNKNIFLTTILLISISFYAQKTIPDLNLKSLDGKTVALKELTKGKTIAFSFWATWCGPCVNELDAIAEQYDDLKEEGFELIAISIDDTRTKSRVKPMVNGKDWDYQVLLDSNQAFKRAMNISSVPFVMIVKNGKIVYTHSGYTPGSEEELIEKFNTVK